MWVENPKNQFRVSDPADLEDFEDIVDDLTGEILYTEDKRSEDFNGDRGTMEYQGERQVDLC